MGRQDDVTAIRQGLGSLGLTSLIDRVDAGWVGPFRQDTFVISASKSDTPEALAREDTMGNKWGTWSTANLFPPGEPASPGTCETVNLGTRETWNP